jgi:hypothetical protein
MLPCSRNPTAKPMATVMARFHVSCR